MGQSIPSMRAMTGSPALGAQTSIGCVEHLAHRALLGGDHQHRALPRGHERAQLDAVVQRHHAAVEAEHDREGAVEHAGP